MGNKFFAIKEKKRQKAEKDIIMLMESAGKIFKTNRKMAHLYAKKSRRLAMKNKIKLPANIKRRICKNCYSYLSPGINCRIRTRDGKLIIYCFECKKYTRFVLN